MRCFSFSNGEKKEELTASKFKSTRSNSPNTSGHNARTCTSESVSSDMSSESLWRNALPSSVQKPNNLKVFTSAELKAATRNFSRSLLIGEGGFGCVYKAMISSSENPHGMVEVAVKKLNRKWLQGHKEWVTEVNFLGVIEHPNLVKLVGYCAEDDERGIERFLVYELMPNKSVDDHLSIRSPTTLSWSMRLKIALDAAHGLMYLHEGMDYQVIFRDLKASNILLDEHWNAKLSDFGLARQGPANGLTHVSTAAVGTIGYAAPEYVQTGRLTAKCDVWSYGVLLYVLITGRHPLDRNRPRHEQKLLEWVRPFILDTKKFHMILDPRLQRRYSLKSAWRLSAVANKCLVRQAKSRPKMSEVFEMVKQIVEMESLKTQPQPQPQPLPLPQPAISVWGARTPKSWLGNNQSQPASLCQSPYLDVLRLLQEKAEADRLLDIVEGPSTDMQLHGDEVLKMIQLASLCLQDDHTRRPQMSVVVKVLEGAMEVEPNISYRFCNAMTHTSASDLDDVSSWQRDLQSPEGDVGFLRKQNQYSSVRRNPSLPPFLWGIFFCRHLCAVAKC
ncbi:Serine/threonine-protein kinase pcrk2 [Asimina triloba]